MTWNYIKHSGNRYEHREVAEAAIGKPLPAGAEVHHVNGDGRDNRPENLVILQNRKEHMAIHYRQRALDASGNANYVKCEYCKEYDDPDSADVYSAVRGNGSFRARHRSCHAAANRKRTED